MAVVILHINTVIKLLLLLSLVMTQKRKRLKFGMRKYFLTYMKSESMKQKIEKMKRKGGTEEGKDMTNLNAFELQLKEKERQILVDSRTGELIFG